MYNFETWAKSDFVPIEGQLVVFLVLMGQMLHNRVWFDKYNPSVHPLMHCTTLIVRIFPSPHGIRTGSCGYSHVRMESTWDPRVPAREPYVTCKVHVRHLSNP